MKKTIDNINVNSILASAQSFVNSAKNIIKETKDKIYKDRVYLDNSVYMITSQVNNEQDQRISYSLSIRTTDQALIRLCRSTLADIETLKRKIKLDYDMHKIYHRSYFTDLAIESENPINPEMIFKQR